MSIIQAIILGLVEGITEFLPISSTAHLVVAQKLLGLSHPNEFFTIVVQLGALLAIIYYFRKKLLSLISDKSYGLMIWIASMPTFIVGFFLKDYLSLLYGSYLLISATSIAVAVLLWYSQSIASQRKDYVSNKDLVLMGLFQILSLIPGTSRSGIVIVGGLFSKLSFAKALETSFLFSIPALLVAGVYELSKVFSHGIEATIIIPTAIGTLVSFLCALLTVDALIKVVRRVGFGPFIIYRIIFGLFVLLLN